MAAKQHVEEKVKANKVAVFSKSYCPYCKKAKQALDTLIKGQYYIEELDEVPDGDSIQDALLELTGGRSVPRVFIGGKFFGGGDDTVAALKNGKLAKLIADA
ncbi:hypothetical protein WJX81_008659 [Elliptochloris bilobata]|uniref:Glutaredoxin domain-containing protein n=1 Tax=Elliptochloris bilobata TaxID=381761 RepID=A0AAW1SIN0_9CHLO